MWDNLDEKKEWQAPNLDNPTNDWWDEVAKIERYKQQIEWSRQEALTQRQERISDWQEILSEDVSNLKRLAKVTDTKLVNEVLSKFNFDSLDEALAEYWYLDKKPVNSNWMTKEELEQWYEDRKAKDIHQIAIQEANKAFSDLTEDEKNLALKNFEKITKWKTLTIDEAKEYADMAAIYAIKDKVVKKWDKWQWLVNLAWIWSGNWWLNKGWKDSLDSIIDNW